MPITFEMVALVAILDLVIYVALPEGERFGPLAQRMPRLAWSVLTIFFSTLTGAATQPWLALILGLLLASSLLSGAGATWFQSNGQRKASAPKAR